jgi:lipopolysaccharide transport system ATP-binding protein
VGTGFHPDLTGRENIYFNGTLLGMNREEITRRFDEIVAFAEVDKFIDMQIKHYSSGMQARLGFAVASHLRPDILIIDEVLSVGDLRFQEKCIERMGEMRKSGITTLFVSHNLNSVSALCARSMLLERGRLKAVGETYAIIDQYMGRTTEGKSLAEFQEDQSRKVSIHRVSLENEDGARNDLFDLEEDVWIKISYSVRAPAPGLQVGIVLNLGHQDLTHTFDTDDHAFLGEHPVGMFEKRARVRRMFLKEGEYTVDVHCGTPAELYDYHHGVLKFTVRARSLNTEHKAFRRERLGRVIFQGEWHDCAPAN